MTIAAIAKSVLQKTGPQVIETPTAPKPKPTATWSRSLSDNITPQCAAEQGNVQKAPFQNHEKTFKSIGELAAELVRKAGAQ